MTGRIVSSAIVLSLVLVGPLAIAACGDDPPPRAEVLTTLADDIVVPAFEAFAARAGDLVGEVEAVCGGDEAAISAAVDGVERTREQWLSTQAMWTGPVMERRSPAVVDWPVRTADIEALVERSAPGDITAEVVGNSVGADTRGLTAMRWVLTADDVAERLEDPRWCDYLAASSMVIAAEADVVAADWTESWDGGPPYRARIGADDEWLGMLVNDAIFLVHALTEPVREEGDVAPVDVAADRAAQLDGVAAVVDELSPLLDDDLSERLGGEVETAATAFAGGDVEAGRAAAAEVEATLATEVASRLDVTIGFSDADGDSAG